MTISYLEGFLDNTTIKALEQADGCAHTRKNGYGFTVVSQPLIGTMWYDSKTGSIRSFEKGKPPSLVGNEHIIPTLVLFDATGDLPLPKLYRSEEITPALETALASIKAYRRN